MTQPITPRHGTQIHDHRLRSGPFLRAADQSAVLVVSHTGTRAKDVIMSTHTNTLTATFACAAVALIALSTASAEAPDGSAPLPGDVRVWELNHPAAAPALLPGDLRGHEQRLPAQLVPARPAEEARVVMVDDDAVEVLQIGGGALAGIVGASAVALLVSSRRVRASAAGAFGPGAAASTARTH